MGTISQEARGLVLDLGDHGESDKIVTFYCEGIGRLTTIAKGAKRSRKRFMNKLELFSLLTLHYRPSRAAGLAFLAEAELLDSHLSLRTDPDRYYCASVIRELLLLATREQGGDDELFSLCCWALGALNHNDRPLTALCIFLIRFYDCIGYGPNLSSCHHCGQSSLESRSHYFHSGSSSLVCSRCRKDEFDVQQPISAGTLKMLQSAREMELIRLSRLRFTAATAMETITLLHQYSRTLFQREINSLKFLRGQISG
ncbi:MAG: DNA repair protein RecO [Thermodesulfobacteriota bacterium]